MTPSYSARQTVVDGVEAVQLADDTRGIEVSIATEVGNIAYEFKRGGANYLYFPFRSPAELKQRPTLCGVPFLAPWANRIDGDAFWANGKQYRFNPELGNLRRDGRQKPIHGLVSFSPAWTRVAAESNAGGAWATSRLEFWKHPEMLAQFPFAHTITMTHRLANGELEVETEIENHSTDPMPVAIGFHPYFQVHDAPRDDWKAHVPARDHFVLNENLIPTGERKPMDLADPQPLRGRALDDVFGNLVREPDGRAKLWVEGARERLTVTFGPKYTVAVVYAPPGRQFICFEPMAAVTNGFNLAHAGVYSELQSIPAGGKWRESFWIAI
jgi:aldose 1-epimerase